MRERGGSGPCGDRSSGPGSARRGAGAALAGAGPHPGAGPCGKDAIELCAERPRDRASLLRALVERGHPSLEQGPINTFVPWLSSQGLIVTDTAGRLHAADPPAPVDHDEALAILGTRYRAGYGRRATRPTSRSGPRCRSPRRVGRLTPPAHRATPAHAPPMRHRTVCCWPPLTRLCSGTAPANRSSPEGAIITSSRAAAWSNPSFSTKGSRPRPGRSATVAPYQRGSVNPCQQRPSSARRPTSSASWRPDKRAAALPRPRRYRHQWGVSPGCRGDRGSPDHIRRPSSSPAPCRAALEDRAGARGRGRARRARGRSPRSRPAR